MCSYDFVFFRGHNRGGRVSQNLNPHLISVVAENRQQAKRFASIKGSIKEGKSILPTCLSFNTCQASHLTPTFIQSLPQNLFPPTSSPLCVSNHQLVFPVQQRPKHQNGKENRKNKRQRPRCSKKKSKNCRS